jgi:uncharacterized protein (DUF1015 family)
MVTFAPIRGIRPAPGLASAVVELPYDVMSRQEAAKMVLGRPNSLLHVTRPEIDLPADCDFDDPRAYAAAAAAYARLRECGALVADEVASYYAYRITRGNHQQTGVVGGAGVGAYSRGEIRRHELTRPAKQSDRAAHIQATGAQTGPVFLIHRSDPTISAILAAVTAEPAQVVVSRPDDTHELWPIAEPDVVAALEGAFANIPTLFIADGHHRSAAAEMVAANSADPEGELFLAVTFPADDVTILPYNRLIRVPGVGPEEILRRVREVLSVQPAAAAVAPYRRGEFGLYVAGQWWLATDPGLANPQDPVAGLDVSVLQDFVLGPLLGVGDPRTDPNITFVGGVRGVGALARAVDDGEADIAISLCATTVDELLGVAEAHEMMPPKSTWFEPKLLDGMVIHEIGPR